MKSKYFSAESREEAEAMAAAFFGRDTIELTFEVMGGGEAGQALRLLALYGTQEDLRNAEGSFGVYYEDDAVYLEMYKERGAGHPVDVSAMLKYLNRKSIRAMDSQAIQNVVSLGSGRVKIGPPQEEFFFGEDIVVEVTNDEAEAYIKLLEPEPGGAMLELEETKTKILEAGVTHGLNEQALQEALEKKRYGENQLIAEAIPQEDGEDGKLVFHFSTDERTGKPREIGGGRVDYRSLDLYEPVTEGQLLVTRTFATEGKSGATVRGKELKPRPGKEVNLPRGKNVDINPEKTEMLAKCSGMVELLNGSVNVSSVYKVNGDVDISVGNIDFDGSVHVSGSVRSGHTVKATGAVVVGGGVEAATIIAGGNIEIKSGMQGADKGKLEAGGSITAMYIERGSAVADGGITLDVSIHSVLEAGGTLKAKGRRGAVIGGRAAAAGDIIANSLGAISHITTEIEVGVMPRKRARINSLEKEVERLKTELVKLDQLDTYLKNQEGKIPAETWDKLHRSGQENRRVNDEIIEDLSAEITDLRYELEHATDGKVHVFDTAFSGTKIIIANGMYKVNDDIKYASFKYKDAEVVYGPCDMSKPKE
jgi:hypothetical protein